MTASMTTSSRNQTNCRLYGAANRAIRRTVPGGSRLSVTDESRRNECMTCQPAGPPIDMSPPSDSTLDGPGLFPKPDRSGEGGHSGEGAADQQLLHLRGALVEGRHAGVAKQLADDELVDVAVAAVHLDGVVGRADADLGRVVLRLRGSERVFLAPRLEVGDPPGHQPRCLGLDRGVGDELLDELEPGDRPAELLTLLRVRRHRVESGLRKAGAGRGERHPPIVEGGEGHLDAVTL